MPDELDALLDRVDDAGLRSELRDQIEKLRRRRQFGLVYESHLPERVRLPDHPIRRGSRVVRRDADAKAATREVLRVKGDAVFVDSGGGTAEEIPRQDLVVVAEFGDPIYPGFRRLGSLDRGGEKPAHVVIKGENFHVLEALRFSHAGKVDCIYIDPPYNTGARDWKYDNDYVDGEDAYRHSKWLAFMERRLRLSRDLLNLENSVLVVAIDEREVHRLGLLLEQVFPEVRAPSAESEDGKRRQRKKNATNMQLVTVVMNRAGSPRPGRLTRVEEYLYFVFFGKATAAAWTSNLLSDDESEDGLEERSMPTVWFSAIRVGGRKALRSYYDETELFYPVLLDAESGALHSVGPPLPMDKKPGDYAPPPGTVAVWPMSKGREQTWRFSRDLMEEYFRNGTARLGRRDPETGLRPVTYLRPGTLKEIQEGVFTILGRTDEGALQLGLADSDVGEQRRPPVTVWNRTSHYARDHGSKLNGKLIPGREFPYPKSLYAVEDALRVAVGDKPDAVILDYFAGSGTTAHAVARLNRQDGGARQSISVTNNEVSAQEAEQLLQQSIRPGDELWERAGIFENITRPRLEAAVTGRTPDGDPIDGSYSYTDEFAMSDGLDENVEFLGLRYLDVEDVELDLAFEAVSPLLWMRAGGQGPVIEHRTSENGRLKVFDSTDQYGVLFEPDRWRGFVEELSESVTTVFIVTDSPSVFASVAAELPSRLDVVRLYENYLSTFAINRGR